MEEEKDLNEMFKSQFKLFFSESERAKEAFRLSTAEVGEQPEREGFVAGLIIRVIKFQ